MKKDFIAREITREIVVGTFIVMIFLGLFYFTIILSREAWFSRKYPMEVEFAHVMGLREGDNVVVRGMPIGTIKSLELVQGRVHVRLSLDKQLHMKKDYVITIVSTSILGGRYLEVVEGSAEHPDMPLGSRFVGREPYDLVSDAAELINSAKAEFIEGGIIENIKVTTEELRTVITRVREGKGTVGRILSEDDTIYNDLAAAIASLKDVSGRLERGEGTLGKLLSADGTVYADLSETVASLKSITARIENGEGALGRLLADDSVYEELEAILRETRAAVDDFRETSPVVTFTSIFFGAL